MTLIDASVVVTLTVHTAQVMLHRLNRQVQPKLHLLQLGEFDTGEPYSSVSKRMLESSPFLKLALGP
jgi:hypothetical protein